MGDTNKIIEAISMKLDSVFNDGESGKYTIYGEEIKQGLVEPCFFVKLLNSNMRQIVGNRYFGAHFFDVHYFPENALQPEQEMLDVADRLYEALEYIEYEGELLRGTNMNYEMVDDVLHFFVNFDYYFKREMEKNANIESLEYLRGGKK